MSEGAGFPTVSGPSNSTLVTGVSKMPETGLVNSIIGWYAKPFNSQGSALTWVLWVGLLIVAIGLWNIILIDLGKEL